MITAKSLGAWLGQVTTGHGMAVAAATVTGLLTGAISWPAAIPALVGAAFAIVWPEQTGIASQASSVADASVRLAESLVALSRSPVAPAASAGTGAGESAKP